MSEGERERERERGERTGNSFVTDFLSIRSFYRNKKIKDQKYLKPYENFR